MPDASRVNQSYSQVPMKRALTCAELGGGVQNVVSPPPPQSRKWSTVTGQSKQSVHGASALVSIGPIRRAPVVGTRGRLA